MATIEKIKKKKGAAKVSAVGTKAAPKDEKGSVISVKEATTTDQHDTVEKGSAEANTSEKPASPSHRPASAASQRSAASPSHRPASAASQRSVPPAQIMPVPLTDKTGSMVSLKSKEAWTDAVNSPASDSRPNTAVSRTSVKNDAAGHTEASTNPFGSRWLRSNNAVGPSSDTVSQSSKVTGPRSESRPGSRPGSARPGTSSSSIRDIVATNTNTSVEPDNQVTSFGPAEMNESHAYVPYLYARDSLSKIVTDMKNMKINHIRIVHDIEGNFRSIEEETQAQFNHFVLNLRDQYSVKVKTFRQVIEVHRLELQQKDQYWDELLMSLSSRNTELLRDKKVLLIQNKVEFERLEKEKNDAILALTTRLDETNAAHAKEIKEMEAMYEEKLKQMETKHGVYISDQNTVYEGEKKVLSDSLETEKQEVERLRRQIEELEKNNEQLIAAAAVVTTSHVAAEQSVVVADMSEEDRARMEEQRVTMATERDAMVSDRQAMEKEREEFAALRLKFQEDHVVLQGDLNESNKAKEEWKIRYESLKNQLGELTEIKAKYIALSAQFAALSALAVAAAVEDTSKTDEKIGKTEADRDIMLEEKVQMDRDIEKWEAEFQKKNNREPNEDEKPDSIKELYTSRAEVNVMVTSLDTQIETLETLKKGEVPTVAAVAVAPITIQEPEIKTIEVKVPDPEVVAALQAAEANIDILKSQIAADKDESSELRGNISDLQAELEQAKAEISKLEAQISSLEVQLAAGLAVGVAVGENKELEDRIKKLEKEKKGVSKDLKAALKAQGKISAEAESSKKLLEITVKEARDVNNQAEKAGELLGERLKDVQALEEHDQEEDHQLTIQALEMLSTGAVPKKASATVAAASISATVAVDNEAVEQLKEEKEELQSKNTELEDNYQKLEQEMEELKIKLAAGASLDATAVAMAASSGDDLEELSGQMSELQQQVDDAEARLAQEKSAHAMTRDELEAVQSQIEILRAELEEKMVMHTANLDASSNKAKAEITNLQLKLTAAEGRVEELDKARLANVPIDTQKEIKALKAKLAVAVKEKDVKVTGNAELEAEIQKMKAKMTALEKSSSNTKTASVESDQKLKLLKTEKDKEMKEAIAKYEKREKDRAKQEEKKIGALEKKIQQLQVAAASGTAVGAAAGKAGKADKAGPDKATMEKLRQTKQELTDANNRIKQLEKELKEAQKSGSGGNIEAEREKKKQEKVLKELEKKLDQMMKKNEKNEQNLKQRVEELEISTKDNTTKDREIVKLQAELEGLGAAAAEGLENAAKVKDLSAKVKELTEENKELTENYNSERVLRKKYYNMVEDMKGKIRVYCRVRPMSKSELDKGCHAICRSPDEYTIHIDGTRGLKEFQFDNIFMPETTQERVFEDTNNLIQSAVDGYNVCIFAYGQTGSGKTFTVIGDSGGKLPGIAPRAFQRIFELADEQKAKFTFKVSVYMMELYNDKLLDLFTKTGANEDKMDIKKDKKGMVVVQGAEVKTARNAQELWSLFEEGSKSRHTASTKMNAESSRSHLVVGIVIESTNKVSGQVTKGKLSLVDLAGSERAAKTEASAEQLKEAMSINKSLSALGDVISALSSEQSFIPYRNNKLTMLMQDSLGGNAKTLMFVNVSPADYNADETVTSLTYAARVKLITNDASKNADNKEISRLKNVIAKLKRGEAVEEEAEGEEEAAE